MHVFPVAVVPEKNVVRCTLHQKLEQNLNHLGSLVQTQVVPALQRLSAPAAPEPKPQHRAHQVRKKSVRRKQHQEASQRNVPVKPSRSAPRRKHQEPPLQEPEPKDDRENFVQFEEQVEPEEDVHELEDIDEEDSDLDEEDSDLDKEIREELEELNASQSGLKKE